MQNVIPAIGTSVRGLDCISFAYRLMNELGEVRIVRPLGTLLSSGV